MAMSDAMVLCVDCMKCVGRSGASSRPLRAFRKDSEFSMQPKSVPMTTASGTAVTLSPGFSADGMQYTVKVPKGTGSVTVSATPVSSKAKIAGTGKHTVSGASTRIVLTVTAESGAVTNVIVTVKTE